MIKAKKGMELPVNIVVMLIIGIVIFSLGLGLFSKIAKSSESQVDDLQNRIKTGISSLECDGEEWVCVPKVIIKNGKSQSFSLFAANRADEAADFKVSISSAVIEKNDCGSIEITPYTGSVNIEAKESAQIPFIVDANHVEKTPCSFIGTFVLNKISDSYFEEKTTLIVQVE